LTEGQAFLRAHDSAPRPPPSPPVCQLRLSLSLPVCRRPSLLTGYGGRGWVWSRIIRRHRKPCPLYTVQHSLHLSHGGVENTQDQFPQLLSGKYLQKERRQKHYRQEAANLPHNSLVIFLINVAAEKKRCVDATVHQSPPLDAFSSQTTKSLEGQWKEIVYTVQQPIYDIKCWVYCLSCMVELCLCCLSGDQSCSIFCLLSL
jgi:hypothetical protein